MSQTVALILQSRRDADRVEHALVDAGMVLREVRPSVFHVTPVPEYLINSQGDSHAQDDQR